MTNGLVEIAKLVGTLSVATMSMSVVTYALAVPRLQAALSAGIKANRESKGKLERRIKEEAVTLREIEDQLKAIENDQKEMHKVVARLSWNKVVVVPAILASLALGFVAVLIEFSSVYDLAILVASVALVFGAFFHLLRSLRLIEQTAVRPGLSVEG